MHALKRLLLRLEDWARTGSLSRLKSLALRLRARVLSPQQRVAARASYLVAWHPLRGRREFVTTTVAIAARKPALTSSARIIRSILLKRAVSPAERGVLLVSFEPELAKLACLASLPQLEEHYAIVFLPTWQPFYSDALFTFAARARRPFWLMPSSTADQALCADLGPLCRPMPFQASSWVSHAQYERLDAPKTIDLLMLANFNSYKRHWLLFEAARDLPDTIRIVLAGRRHGPRTVNSLLAEADAFGVRHRIAIHEDPSDGEVATLLASAKLFCALSHKEGSYIAVAEALMADTAVVMFSDAIVGSKEYIGPDTGWLLEPGRALAPQLMWCLDRVTQLHPRRWAKENVAAEVNYPRFNELMRRDALQTGEMWTTHLAGFFCRHFEFEYFDGGSEASLQGEYSTIRDRFGLDIARNLRPNR